MIGLGLVLFSDPAIRLVSGTSFSGFPSGGFSGDSSIFQTCRTVTNETVQQCLANNGVSFSGFGGTGGARFDTGAIGSISLYESFGGIALIAIGSLLVLVQIFRMPTQNSRF